MEEDKDKVKSIKSNSQKSKEGESAGYWADLLEEEFSKESDRAAVILTATLLNNALDEMLRIYLVPVSSANDDLFDGPNAPLNSFSSKIDIAFRLGLISLRLARDLHLIRKIRNDFAHNVRGCEFDQASIKSRISQLVKSSINIIKDLPVREKFPLGTRGDFLIISSWILFSLHLKIERLQTKEVAELEFGYRFIPTRSGEKIIQKDQSEEEINEKLQLTEKPPETKSPKTEPEEKLKESQPQR